MEALAAAAERREGGESVPHVCSVQCACMHTHTAGKRLRACNAAGESNLGKRGVRGRRPSSKTLRRTRSRVDDMRLPPAWASREVFVLCDGRTKTPPSAQKRSFRRSARCAPFAAPCDESRVLPPLSLTPARDRVASSLLLVGPDGVFRGGACGRCGARGEDLQDQVRVRHWRRRPPLSAPAAPSDHCSPFPLPCRCAQCHVAEKGAGHRQARELRAPHAA